MKYKQKTNHPHYGEVIIDDNGLTVCHICGRGGFKKLLSHVWQVHGLNEKEYKYIYGLDSKKGICCEETHELLRNRVMENYNVAVLRNLLNKGQQTRFQMGSMGRTRTMVREQTRKMLVKHISRVDSYNYKKSGEYTK